MKNANKVPSATKNGFSLLEMSITLTIISLLIAATLTGQNIKHRQELSQIIADISSITSAVTQFRTTYSYYPGDLTTATTTFTSYSATTSNGDGNGYLATALGGSPTVFDQRTTAEEYLFWYHLTQSGLLSPSISGTYGTASNGTYDGSTVVGDGGVMKASLGYGLYQARKATNFPSSGMNPTAKLVIQVSKAGGYGIFSTKEAYDLDAKYDNTAPLGTAAASTIASPSGTLGTISAIDGTGDSGNCVVDGTGAVAPTYKLSNLNGTPCVLYFYLE